MKNQNIIDKKKLIREKDRLTRPPRLERRVKNSNKNLKRKKGK